MNENQKKILIYIVGIGILLSVMIAALVSCGGEKPEETSIPTETSMATQPTKPAKKPTPKPGKKPDNKKPDASKPTETTAATEPDHGSSGNGSSDSNSSGSSSGGSSSGSSSSNSGYSGGGSSGSGSSSGGSSYEEPKPQPTEPPAPKPTDPPATQPPVTEHVHTWNHEHTDEVGHWGESKFVCQECGWSCTESQAAAAGLDIGSYYYIYHKEVVEGGLLYHSYDDRPDWIVDVPESDTWTCTGCGEVTTSDPT